jgi:methionyl-tRNA formyltransferase
METIIVASLNSVYKESFKRIQKNQCNYNWIYIDDKESFNFEYLKEINPIKIFLPHWSFIIPSKFFLNFDCIVFHMTDLPYGRGGSPLQNLIVRGHDSTMLSALRVASGIDTGDIYLKRPLSLEGTATSIFNRAALIIEKMIEIILEQQLVPIPQQGSVTSFSRRKPEDSNMESINDLTKVYDYIRMLDAPDYPKAFIATDQLKFEFTSAHFANKNEITANVRIIKK